MLQSPACFFPAHSWRFNIVGSPGDREGASSVSDRQGSNFESCVWRAVPYHSSYHRQAVLLAQFSLYVHKDGLKPHSFHFKVPFLRYYIVWRFFIGALEIPTATVLFHSETAPPAEFPAGHQDVPGLSEWQLAGGSLNDLGQETSTGDFFLGEHWSNMHTHFSQDYWRSWFSRDLSDIIHFASRLLASCSHASFSPCITRGR